MTSITTTELARNTRRILDLVNRRRISIDVRRNQGVAARIEPVQLTMTAEEALARLVPNFTPEQGRHGSGIHAGRFLTKWLTRHNSVEALPLTNSGYRMIAPEIAAQAVAISALARRYGARRLSLFGSAATGNFDAMHSDVDFLGDLPELPPAEYENAYFDLHTALENLPGRSVDLVVENKVRDPYLLKTINVLRISSYGA